MATPDWAQKLLAARTNVPDRIIVDPTKVIQPEIQSARAIPQPTSSIPSSPDTSDDSLLTSSVSTPSNILPGVGSLGSSAPTQYEIIHERILSLSSAILADHPTIPTLLQEIRRTLKNDPALVTLLQPSDIRTIVNGLEKQTGVYLAASLTSPKAAAKAKLKNVSTSDLGF